MTKLNAPKTPNGTASVAKSSKKKVVQAPKEDDPEAKEEMTEAEKRLQQEKLVLYLRHRLQKGFLSRDQAPQEAEMSAMNDYIIQLEGFEYIEPVIIRNTKVHKVLKAIVKLSSIPREEEYNFKKRSAALLEIWNKRMESDGDVAPPSAVEPKGDDPFAKKEEETNGDKATTPLAAALVETKEEMDVKLGAEKDVEAKAEKVAEEIDEKVAPVVDPVVEDKMDIAERPAVPSPAPVAKAEPSTDAMDVTTDVEAAKDTTTESVVPPAKEAA